MDVATTKQNLAGVNRLDCAIRETILKDVNGGLVVLVIKHREDDSAVAVVVVNVACRETVAFVARERALDHINAFGLFFGDCDWVRDVDFNYF